MCIFAKLLGVQEEDEVQKTADYTVKSGRFSEGWKVPYESSNLAGKQSLRNSSDSAVGTELFHWQDVPPFMHLIDFFQCFKPMPQTFAFCIDS